MTLRATTEKAGYCARCRRDVQCVRPWPHWRRIRYVYFAGLGVALCGAPVLLADGFVLIPLLMIYIASIGPLNALVRQRSTCARCGALVDKLRGLRLVSSKSEPDRADEPSGD